MKKYLVSEHVQLVHSGKNYFDIAEHIINNAARVLHLQTYIFETDHTGRRIIDALKRAAQRGVDVFVLADAFGSYPFPRPVAEELTKAGIHFRLFAPLFSTESIYFGRRLHHKIIVADKQVGLTGGINIADKYNINQQEEPWLDYAVLTKGEVCEYLHVLCECIYKKQNLSALAHWEKNLKYKVCKPRRLIRFRRNDWIKNSSEIHNTYGEALSKATRSVIIVASYFLPGRHFRNLLKKAAQRGVDIKIILAGKSDVASVHLAENYLYDFYFRNNIKIFEWQNSVMHGKAMLADDEWMTVGSYNLNYLSHYISIELNADIIDEEMTHQFKAHLLDIMQHHCCAVSEERMLAARHWTARLKRWLAYNFYRLIMNIVLIAKRQRKHTK